jgi:tritrans,polycis-undecaprenyl-diphosphate synthase [geranylgeranyl-diphosphate specific]
MSGLIYRFYERRLMREVSAGELPRHVAVIMDGNRRYASEAGLDKRDGHALGKEKIIEMLGWCLELKIRCVTAFAFSTENLQRAEEEVRYIMGLSESGLREVASDQAVRDNKVRIRVIGDRSSLPESVKEAAEHAEEATKSNDGYVFNIAMGYGGRREIIDAVKEVAAKVRDGEMSIDDITEDRFSSHLYTGGLPDPDLVLRTSGEVRVSNFLMWQIAYSELYFTDVFWPEFRKLDFLRAIRSYQQRRRRYGR